VLLPIFQRLLHAFGQTLIHLFVRLAEKLLIGFPRTAGIPFRRQTQSNAQASSHIFLVRLVFLFVAASVGFHFGT